MQKRRERAFDLIILKIGFCTILEAQLDHSLVAILTRTHERCIAVLVALRFQQRQPLLRLGWRICFGYKMRRQPDSRHVRLMRARWAREKRAHLINCATMHEGHLHFGQL
jgi:hypothetical protein